MKQACIAIVDAAHARLFVYDEQRRPDLREERDLVNAGRQAHARLSDPGTGFTGDHRSAQIAEHEHQFARHVIDEVSQLLAAHRLPRLVLIASPKMLGGLRTARSRRSMPHLHIEEVAQDLAWMTSAQVHQHLVVKHLIAPRPRS